jgi:type I restriction-modification system DNA methylase subunit
MEKSLWDAADQFRANSGLKAQEYSGPILGLIFIRFAEVRFITQRSRLKAEGTSSRRGNRVEEPTAYHADGVLFLAPDARFDYLLTLPEGEDVGARVNTAMREIESYNPILAGVLPKSYNLFTNTLLKELLKKISEIQADVDFDAFGRIYEYFLGEFARTEGQKGGEFYTPSSIVKVLTEIIEPFHGRILDPACGSGGMFVQSARFVAEHQKNPAAELAICGVETCTALKEISGTAATLTATTMILTTPLDSSTSFLPIRLSMLTLWTKSVSKIRLAPVDAFPSASPIQTMRTTFGSSFSIRHLTPRDAPDSSWPTRQPMHEVQSRTSADSSSRIKRLT